MHPVSLSIYFTTTVVHSLLPVFLYIAHYNVYLFF